MNFPVSLSHKYLAIKVCIAAFIVFGYVSETLQEVQQNEVLLSRNRRLLQEDTSSQDVFHLKPLSEQKLHSFLQSGLKEKFVGDPQTVSYLKESDFRNVRGEGSTMDLSDHPMEDPTLRPEAEGYFEQEVGENTAEETSRGVGTRRMLQLLSEQTARSKQNLHQLLMSDLPEYHSSGLSKYHISSYSEGNASMTTELKPIEIDSTDLSASNLGKHVEALANQSTVKVAEETAALFREETPPPDSVLMQIDTTTLLIMGAVLLLGVGGGVGFVIWLKSLPKPSKGNSIRGLPKSMTPDTIAPSSSDAPKKSALDKFSQIQAKINTLRDSKK